MNPSLSIQKMSKRAMQALEIAKDMARKLEERGLVSGHTLSNRLEEIKLYSHYSEKGYEENGVVIATGNWNTIGNVPNSRLELPKRLERIFTKLGVEIEWSDEWASCDDCNGLFRTQPDCFDWTPSYTVNLDKGEKLCRHCALSCDCPP